MSWPDAVVLVAFFAVVGYVFHLMVRDGEQ